MKTRILIRYLALAITYSVLRVPLAAILYGFFPEVGSQATTAHILRFIDPFIYFPFVAIIRFCRYLDKFEETGYALAAYYVGIIVVVVGWISWKLFRFLYRVIDTLLRN